VSMTWNDAAEHILENQNTPLRYTDLANKILQAKLVDTASKTPSITLHASITIENQNREARGIRPRFVIVRGEVSLLAWETTHAQESFAKKLDENTGAVRDELLRRLRNLTGEEFESFIEALLIKMEYENIETRGGPSDEGIDLLCEMSQGINQVKTAVQAKCKQPQNRVGPNDVRLLRDVLPKFKCSQGVLITTSDFTKEAREAATEEGRQPIILIDGKKLVELSIEHEIGVKARSFKQYFIDEDFELFHKRGERH